MFSLTIVHLHKNCVRIVAWNQAGDGASSTDGDFLEGAARRKGAADDSANATIADFVGGGEIRSDHDPCTNPDVKKRSVATKLRTVKQLTQQLRIAGERRVTFGMTDLCYQPNHRRCC